MRLRLRRVMVASRTRNDKNELEVQVESIKEKLSGRPSEAPITALQDTIEIEKREAKRKKAWWVIDPRKSRAVGQWDSITSLALLFTAVVTPYEVSFLPAPTPETMDALFWINRVVDLVFIADMSLQFCLSYPDFVSIVEGSSWVDDPARICRHYLKGWFSIDLISIVPFDVISFADSSGVLVRLKALRVIRLLRLIKMVRLLRASRLLSRWRTKVSISNASQSMCKCIAAVLTSSHWLACLWMLQTTFYARTPVDNILHTWLAPAKLCWADLERPDGEDLWQCQPPEKCYVASLYFAMYTITSVGFGDITPVTDAERVVCILVMLLAGVLWGLVIATFSGVFATMDPAITAFYNTMDDLNRFMLQYGFGPELKQQLREYFYQTKHLQMSQANRSLLERMSPKLRGDVALRCNAWLADVWFFKSTEIGFLVQVALAIEPLVFAPSELVPPGCLYVLHRGLALFQGRVLKNGSVWGEDMILHSLILRRAFAASAMTYLEVFALQRESLVAVASGFPEAQKHLRKCAIKLALRREILKAALAVKRLKSPMAANAVKNWRRKSMTIVSQRESNRSLAPTSAVPSFEEYYRKQQENDRTPKPLAHAELLAEFRSLLQETEARLDAKVVALGEKLETVLAAKMRGSFSEV